MDKKEQTRLRVQRYRNKQKGVTLGGVTDKGVTQYPAIIQALVNPDKRKKLEKITQSLKDFNQEKNVRYGVDGPTFDVVGDYLEATR